MSVSDRIILTTALLVGGALIGFGKLDADFATRDSLASQSRSDGIGASCRSSDPNCLGEKTALLNAPENVVYKTHADLVESVPDNKQSEDTEAMQSKELVSVPEKPSE